MPHSPPRAGSAAPRDTGARAGLEAPSSPPEITPAAAPHGPLAPPDAPPSGRFSPLRGDFAHRGSTPQFAGIAGPTDAEMMDILGAGDAAFGPGPQRREFDDLLQRGAAGSRPTTPELADRFTPGTQKRGGIGYAPVLNATAHALNGEGSAPLRAQLAARGVALTASDPTGVGAARPLQLTPILEDARRQVRQALGLGTAAELAASTLQLQPDEIALLEAAGIEARLKQLDAVDRQGRLLIGSNGTPLKLGQGPDSTRAGGRSDPDASPAPRGMIRLSKLYSALAAEHDPAPAQQMSEEQRSRHLGRSATLHASAQLLGLVNEHGADGRMAAAFYLRVKNLSPAKSADVAGVMAVLKAAPKNVQRLIDAAHRDRNAGNGSSEALGAAVDTICGELQSTGPFRGSGTASRYPDAFRRLLLKLLLSSDDTPRPLHAWLLAQPPSASPNPAHSA